MNARTISTVLTFSMSLSLLAGTATAQGERLQRAILIEEQERDSKQAASLYRAIAEDAKTSAADRTVAWYRLGRVLKRLGKHAEAKAALEAAAKGKGPTAEAAKKLLGDGGTISDKEKQLRASARSILAANPSRMSQKLLWIGEAAVPEICDAYDRSWRTGNESYVDLIWQIGGKRAEAFLRRVRAEGDKDYKHAIVQGIPSNFHPDLLDVALEYLDDESLRPDDTRRLASVLRERAPIERLVKLTASPRNRVAEHMWTVLGDKISQHPSDQRARAFAVVEKALLRTLNGTDGVVGSAATSFLIRWGTMTRAGLQMLFDRLPSWPRSLDMSYGGFSYPIDVESVLAVAKIVGRADRQDRRSGWLTHVIQQSNRQWTKDKLDKVMELFQLGYMDLGYFGSWLNGSKARERGDHIVKTLGVTRELYGALEPLTRVDLAASNWKILKAAHDKFDRALPKYEAYMFACMGRTGADEALAFLMEQMSGEYTFSSAVTGLHAFSKRRDSAGVRAALRKAIEIGRSRKHRVDMWSTFYQLMAMGDVEAVDLLPRLGSKHAGSRLYNSLREWWDEDEKKWKASHGFDGEGLANAWSRALKLDDYRLWNLDLLHRSGGGRHHRLVNLYGGYELRPEMVRMFIEKLEPLTQQAPFVSVANRDNIFGNLLNLPGRWSKETPTDLALLQQFTNRCLDAKSPTVQQYALYALQGRKLLPEQRKRVLALLQSKSRNVVDEAFKVVQNQITLSEDEFTALLKSGGSAIRQKMLGSYLLAWKGQVALSTVVPALSDPSPTVRVMVCHYLGRRTDPAAVKPLLGTMRDPDAGVRNAAKQALQAIRFYHEQKAHWDRMFKGAGSTGANSAAEKLVQQASPKEGKAVRLLAIKSLGLLGKVEVVPFLIEFSKEKDREIAAAAKAAIAAIHAKAGGK